MSISAFLASLFESGRVRVPPLSAQPVMVDTEEVRSLLDARTLALALNFPGDPPPLDWEVGLWAVQQMYRASQLAVYRELDAQVVEQLLRQDCPPAPPAVRHWSVDLTFAFLPDLVLLARSASQNDPLVVQLLQWAADWPLSSVGVQGVSPRNISEIHSSDGLLQLYVDRILAKKDWPRLKDDAVQSAALARLGAYLAEWPEIAKHLESLKSPA